MAGRINDNFKRNLSQWIALERKLKEHTRVASELRRNKATIEESLLKYISNNGLDNTQINVGTMRVVPNKGSQLPPLNMEFLETTLNEILGNPGNVNKIMDRIRRKREMGRKETFTLKYKTNRSNRKKKV
jgi:hypothetical protein